MMKSRKMFKSEMFGVFWKASSPEIAECLIYVLVGVCLKVRARGESPSISCNYVCGTM